MLWARVTPQALGKHGSKNVRIKYIESVRIEIEKLKIKIEKQVTSKAVTFPVASVTKSFSDLKNSRFNH